MPSNPSPNHQPLASDARQQMITFFLWLYDIRYGWVEICYAPGHPDDGLRRGIWIYYAGTVSSAAEFADICLPLARRYGDVYVGRALYAADPLTNSPDRRKDLTLQTPVLFIDDAPPGRYTFSVQTSDGNIQAYIVLDEPVAMTLNEQLCRKFAYRQADRGGWDITQLARVPGTANTKYSAPWPVTLEMRTMVIYPVAILRQPSDTIRSPGPQEDMPDVSTHPDAAQVVTTIMRWRADPSPIETPDGLPRRWKRPDQPGWAIMRGEQAYDNQAGTAPDTSRMRWHVALDMRLVGYPDDEIAYYLWAHCQWPTDRPKSKSWMLGDIARILSKLPTAVKGGISASQQRPWSRQALPAARQEVDAGLQPALDRPAESPTVPLLLAPSLQPLRAAGRPRKLDAGTLLEVLQAHADAEGVVTLTQQELASALGVSQDTIVRAEQRLRAQGEIGERIRSNDRQRSSIRLLRPAAAADQPYHSASQAHPAPEQPGEGADSSDRDVRKTPDAATEAQNDPRVGRNQPIVESDAAERDPQSPDDTSATDVRGANQDPVAVPEPAPSLPAPNPQPAYNLAALVRLALDDEGRASLPKVRRYLADNVGVGFYPDDAIQQAYRIGLNLRRTERENLSPLTWPELRRLQRACSYHIGESHAAGNKSWRHWSWRLAQVDMEMDRRMGTGRTLIDTKSSEQRMPPLDVAGETHEDATVAIDTGCASPAAPIFGSALDEDDQQQVEYTAPWQSQREREALAAGLPPDVDLGYIRVLLSIGDAAALRGLWVHCFLNKIDVAIVVRAATQPDVYDQAA